MRPLILASCALLAGLAVLLATSGRTGASPLDQAVSPTPTPLPPQCLSPVDISLVFDHSGSMSQNNKLVNAQAAVNSFVDTIDNNLDSNLSPHQMALTGFANGDAQTDIPLTTAADTIKQAVTGYLPSGFTIIVRGLQLG